MIHTRRRGPSASPGLPARGIRSLTLVALLGHLALEASADEDADDAAWPPEVVEVEIPRSEGEAQPALLYLPPAAAAAGSESDHEPAGVPLLIGLHPWSGHHRTSTASYGAPYARWCIRHGWAFVHPEFGGPNRRPEACGSERAIEDVLDALRFVKARADIDEDRVCLVGVSGGGHAAMLLAGRHPELWAGVSAWVGISDLGAWHAETRAAGRRYWKDVEAVCEGAPGSSAAVDEQLRRRSPLHWLPAARGLALDLNAGIRDGHDGSVPVHHSLRAFNAVCAPEHRLELADIETITREARIPAHLGPAPADPRYGAHPPLFRRTSGPARVTIFDGGHQILPEAALHWLSRQRRRASR